ncbi:hypothetical protein QYF36_022016 [Acer negundo]|nr:hypothetical protein QYF36_022016 [Acer negundo]
MEGKRVNSTADEEEIGAMESRHRNPRPPPDDIVHENCRDWNPLPTMGSDMSDRSTGSQSITSLHFTRHQMPGSEEAQTSGPDSMIPMGPVLLVYNFPTETGTSDATTSLFSGDEALDSSDSSQTFDLSEGLDQSEVPSTSSSMRRASLSHQSTSEKSLFAASHL